MLTTNQLMNRNTRTATVVVAAADSPNKEAADYICEAGNIDAIKTAVAALPATGDRKIVLMGDFTKDDVDGIELGSNTDVELIGSITFADAMASGAVIFANADTIVGNENIHIFGGILDGNKGNQTNEQTAIDFTKVGQSTVDCIIQNFKGKNIVDTTPSYGNKYTNRLYPNIEELGFDPNLVTHNHPNWRLLTDFETDEFTQQYGTVVYDTSDKVYGTRSIKFTTPVAGVAGAITSLSKFLFCPTKHRFRMRIKIDNPSGLSWMHRLALTTTAGLDYNYTMTIPLGDIIPNEWTEVMLNVSGTEDFPDPALCDGFLIQFLATAGETVNAWVDQLEVLDPLAPSGLVTFTFDDGNEEHYSMVYKVLKSCGYTGVSGYTGIWTSILETDGKAKEMQANGWDMVNHSWSHYGQEAHTDAEIEDDICKMVSWLKDRGYDGYKYYIAPGGRIEHKDITKKYSIFGRYWDHAAYNSFPNNSCFINVFTGDDSNTVSEAKVAIDRIIERGEWLIFCFHHFDVVGRWTTAEFTELVAYVAEKQVPVATFTDAWNMLKAPQSTLSRSELFLNVLAEDTNHVVAAEDLTAAAPITCTLAAQPDVPRNVTITITDGDTSISAFQIDVVGIGADGKPASEQFLFNRGLVQTGNVAFASVTSVTVASITGDGAGDVLDVGIGTYLGLKDTVYSPDDVFKVTKNAGDYTSYKTVIPYDVVNVGSITAADDFTIYYQTKSMVVK